MEKIYAIIEILKLLVWLTRDSDDDGRPDIFDKEPENPEVQ